MNGEKQMFDISYKEAIKLSANLKEQGGLGGGAVGRGGMPTCVTEIPGFGPGPAGFGTVIAMGVIFIGEQHDSLMAHLELDIAEEVGTDPQHFT